MITDLGEVFPEDFADKISFTSMPLYIFATKPDLDIFEDAQYEGVVKVYYGEHEFVSNVFKIFLLLF